MPIHCPFDVQNLSNEEFKERDHVIMNCAFASQNALGRLCDERVYEKDLARRLLANGFRRVETQVPIIASHHDYSKIYRVDLIADDAVYDLKTVSAMIQEHFAQVLNYAMMLGINHIKLINFRNARVEGMLKYNAILPETRRPMRIDDKGWCAITPECEDLRFRTLDLFADWQGYIDFRLYQDAITHFFGGENQVRRLVPLRLDNNLVGSHEFCCHSNTSCFIVSGYANIDQQLHHIKKLFNLTKFRAAQVINLHRETLTLKTLLRDE